MNIGLSKSRYCKGIQCPKILWMDLNKPEEAEDNLPETVLANGTRVGDLARDYFGNYRLVDYTRDKKAMCDQTRMKTLTNGLIIGSTTLRYRAILQERLQNYD